LENTEKISKMNNIRGRVRGYMSTATASLNLVHINMLRLALFSPRATLKAYADAAFKLYMESRCEDIDFLELGDALRLLDIDPIKIQATLVDLGGYRGRPDWERLFLASVARSRGNRPCFEIGTASGNTTVLLAANMQENVYTLDLPDSNEWEPTLTRLGSDDAVRKSRKRAEFIQKNSRANIVELIGDSAKFDYSGYHDRIGLFFVDGAHSLEYVKSDTMNAAWCCHGDGVIVWDDFTTTRDVTDYLRTLKAAGVKLFGVRGTRLAFTRDIGCLREISKRLGFGPAT
jgi:predicted O-methyltransferase YrrM